jgi:hypothetical protein
VRSRTRVRFPPPPLFLKSAGFRSNDSRVPSRVSSPVVPGGRFRGRTCLGARRCSQWCRCRRGRRASVPARGCRCGARDQLRHVRRGERAAGDVAIPRPGDRHRRVAGQAAGRSTRFTSGKAVLAARARAGVGTRRLRNLSEDFSVALDCTAPCNRLRVAPFPTIRR